MNRAFSIHQGVGYLFWFAGYPRLVRLVFLSKADLLQDEDDA
jgi:hypothetical protein